MVDELLVAKACTESYRLGQLLWQEGASAPRRRPRPLFGLIGDGLVAAIKPLA